MVGKSDFFKFFFFSLDVFPCNFSFILFSKNLIWKLEHDFKREQTALFQIQNSESFSLRKLQLIGKTLSSLWPVGFIAIYFGSYLWMGCLCSKTKISPNYGTQKSKKEQFRCNTKLFPSIFVSSLVIWGEKIDFLVSLGEYYFDFLYFWSDSWDSIASEDKIWI